MALNSIGQIVLIIIFLLPGFILIKVQQYVKEYRNWDVFSGTIQSLFLSIIVIFVWGLINIIYAYYIPHYHFSSYIKKLIFTNSTTNNNGLDGPWVFFAFFSFISTFLILSLMFFIWEWLSLSYLFVIKILGFSNKTRHLTPWEDLFFMSQGKYAYVRTKDGLSYLGKINYVSHHPFDKELILSQHENYSIGIYGDENVPKFEEGKLKHIYLNANEVSSIMIIDTGVTKKNQKRETTNLFLLKIWQPIITYTKGIIFLNPILFTLISFLILQ